jgi:hypothetical protein
MAQKNMFARTQTITSATANPMRISGLTLIPSVSSSKNLSRPALAAGIGADFSFFFLLIQQRPFIILVNPTFLSIINVFVHSKEFYLWTNDYVMQKGV